MSAIWGVIDFREEIDGKHLAECMEEPYHNYKIDVFQQYTAGNVMFGYGGQFFTREARREKQPIVNAQDTFLLESDAVLDNRDELFRLLDIRPEYREVIPDGTLMYQVYRKYGKESYNLFLGTYSFVCYDKEKREATLVIDSLGSRCLYYCFENGRLYFSTLIKPILAARNFLKAEWNYRFLSDYLALNNLSLFTEAEETPYKDIYKVAPGHAVTIKEQGITKEEYWKPQLSRRSPKKRDEEIKKEFVELFQTCVSCVMRSSGKTGILLSGGLDSTSVACLAAPMLREENELLYSYTSIPEEGYVSREKPVYITNEQKIVEATSKYLGNLSCTFMDLPGVNGFDRAPELMDKIELPYKSLLNINWLYELSEKAAADGCRILLTGKFGNATVSYGSYEKQFYSLLRKGRLMELAREVKAYAKSFHTGRKEVYKYIFRIIKFNLLKKEEKPADKFRSIYVNPEILKQYNTLKRFQTRNREIKKSKTLSGRMFKPYISYKPIFTQMGEFETHFSLATGVLQRDPTRDKRMIEFCQKLPDNQYVYRGVERRLVREYLREYLPPEILADIKHRGLQSADMTDRLAKNWGTVYAACSSLLEENVSDQLFDTLKIKRKLEEYREEPDREEGFEMMKLLYSILLMRYVH